MERYRQEDQEAESLAEEEFEDRYRDKIEYAKFFGRNGWVISEQSNPGHIKRWGELLKEGESKVAEFFEEDNNKRLNVIVKKLRKKYTTGGEQMYFNNAMQAFEHEEYMTTAMYPSLIAYLNRAFFDGPYMHKNGIEPPYLNRNWLMHGWMNRNVERYECIQILSALSVTEFMFEDAADKET